MPAAAQSIRCAVALKDVGRRRERGDGDGLTDNIIRPRHRRDGYDRQSVRHRANVAHSDSFKQILRSRA